MAASLFASTDESRFILNGIQIEVTPGKKPTIITTDGRRLCVIETLAEQAEEFASEHTFILRSDFAKPLCSLSKAIGGKLFPWIAISNKSGSEEVTAEIVGGDCFLDVHKNALVEGVYPNWRQTIPKRSKKERTPITDLGINSEFVGDFAKAAKMLESKTAVVQMSLTGEGHAIEVKLAGVSNFYGLIMPCRADESVDYQPEFLQITKQIEQPEPEETPHIEPAVQSAEGSAE